MGYFSTRASFRVIGQFFAIPRTPFMVIGKSLVVNKLSLGWLVGLGNIFIKCLAVLWLMFYLSHPLISCQKLELTELPL